MGIQARGGDLLPYSLTPTVLSHGHTGKGLAKVLVFLVSGAGHTYSLNCGGAPAWIQASQNAALTQRADAAAKPRREWSPAIILH